MGLGIIFGALGGVIGGFASGDDGDECSFWLCYTAEEKAGYGAIIFGILGIPTGGLIGAAIGSTEHYLIEPSLPQAPQDRATSPAAPVSETSRRE